MLRKKILKILSVLVAIIIAFSCFILPCSALTFGEDFNITGFDLSINDVSIDFEKINIIYGVNNISIEISSSVPIVKEGDSVSLYLGLEFYKNFGYRDFVIFYVPNFLSDVGSEFMAVDFDGIKLSSKLSNHNNDLYFDLGFPVKLYDCYLDFESTISTNSLSFVFEVADDVENIEEYLSSNSSDSGSSPAPDDSISSFLSDIGVFFKSVLSWVSVLFCQISSHPAATVLFIGFMVVSFGFVLLYRFIKG